MAKLCNRLQAGEYENVIGARQR